MRLFTYGTLRPEGEPVVTISGYKMYDLGWFPGIIKTGNVEDVIHGSVVPVKDENHLAQLDSYEGCHGNTPKCLYHRVNIHEGQEGIEPTWLYVFNGEPRGDHIPSGDWLEYTELAKGTNADLMGVS